MASEPSLISGKVYRAKSNFDQEIIVVASTVKQVADYCGAIWDQWDPMFSLGSGALYPHFVTSIELVYTQIHQAPCQTTTTSN